MVADAGDVRVEEGERAPEPDELDYITQREQSVRARRSVRSLPTLVREAVGVVRIAAGRLLLLVSLLALLQAVLTAVQVFLAQRSFSVLVSQQAAHLLAPRVVVPVLLLTFASALATALAVVQTQRSRVLAERVQQHVQATVIETCGAVDLLAYERPDFYNQLQRVQISATHRPVEVTSALLALVTGLAASIALGVALVRLAPVLLVLLFLAGVPIALINRRASRSEFDFQVAQTEQARERFYLNDVLTGRGAAKEVRAFTLGSSLYGRWRSSNRGYLGALDQQVRYRQRLGLVSAAVTAVAGIIALAVLLLQVRLGQISLAGAGAAAVAARLLTGRLAALVAGTSSLYEAGLFLSDYQQFLLRRPSGVAAPAATPSPEFSGVKLDGVGFAYPGSGRTVLRGVDLELRAGEVVALVGENGSGKTTLAKIIAGLYDPTEGQVLWGGLPMASLDRDAIRRQVAVIFQDFVQYQLPARENIGVGRPEALDDLEGIIAAARQAGADPYLSKLRSGYDTYLSQAFRGGQDLSLGQWQRVALARAFFREAPFIVLDEPSSALDPRAERDLFNRIRTLLSGRTVLLISHRFSSVRTADRIYVLKDGGIVETGTHATLMGQRGLYAELFTMQADGYRTPTPFVDPTSPDAA